MSTYFNNCLQYQIKKKILLVIDELIHADRQTDTTRLKVAFGYYANAPNVIQRKISTCKNEQILVA